ncbi:hypothetical protein OKW76_07810 [Sphingomonas sp. S1-29]|uniref:hypothetical protein n=1 Tax=Sphingomonas sp. S1-29 TaxID=2991074 RepID=UPI0022401F65|nr:hypothetical protein [Sphingomonas sp. S1-29]UZK70913.1 hypothetical protein OKW76_07810 [Sphingomonas sp. S1-29]
MLEGKWTYRSFINDSALIGDAAAAALALIFGEGIFDFEAESAGRFVGGLGMGQGYALALDGMVVARDPFAFSIVGSGIVGTPTQGWRYDYHGVSGYAWPDGVGQVPSLLGTVIRVVAHGVHAPAGVTASFIAVRQSEATAPRTLRPSMLAMGL